MSAPNKTEQYHSERDNNNKKNRIQQNRKKKAGKCTHIYIEYKSTNLLCMIQCGKAYENIASISICCPLLIHSLDDM